MSEGNNALVLSTADDENLKNEILEGNYSKPTLHPNKSSSTDNAEMPAEKVQENQQSEQNSTVRGSLKSKEEAPDSSPSEQQLSTFEASTETKFLERRADGNHPSVKSITSDGSTDTKSVKRASGNDPSVNSTTPDESTNTKSEERASGNEPSAKSTTPGESTDTKSVKRANSNEPSAKSTTSDGSSDTKSLERASDVDPPAAKSTSTEISPSEAPSSDKGLGKVTEDIQLIYEGLKDMKISTEEIPVTASGKKGRKPPTTPRTRSVPIPTSPPLTRSRSKDLRKFPSTPSSPKRSAGRKTSEGDSEEMKVRGRPRAKKN